MSWVIHLFALFLIIAGLSLLVSPDYLTTTLIKYQHSRTLHWIAVLGRVALGGALVLVAPHSDYPGAFTFLGWLTLLAALILLLMGRHNFQRLIGWASGLNGVVKRSMGLIACVVGIWLASVPIHL
ncbi:hypothetical protein [Paraferrimonas sedimenticola]|uniref:Uncharacterized protein n=1 Tax=Paraferrimonas sedimenticola TaxID=375674 RepID=A0AA37RV82_9GAMM|nr:hypothetical protein [Paraferrimonas sedimenticola]GLP95869.1 hypothetical protein GCM10007895_11750 [Paraferrimonas sedimenticola]